jgi:hypothetical protein
MARSFGPSAALVLLFMAAPAVAQDTPATELACSVAGLSYKVGEFACVPACHEAKRLARCDLVSEKALWTFVSDACPSASLYGPLFSAIPVAAVSLIR